MNIDQQTSIQRSVAMKSATEIFCQELRNGNDLPLTKLSSYYHFILEELQEED